MRRRSDTTAMRLITGILTAALVTACGPAGSTVDAGGDPFRNERLLMVRTQIEARGIRDVRVLRAMRTVPRHEFVPEAHRSRAYADHPLPIGLGQTISQPFIVALMSSLAGIEAGHRVLEIGTGSGYQAAVLAELGAEVFSIELLPEIGARAAANLNETGYQAIRLRVGDGYQGWPDEAPFDRVVVTAAPPDIPEALLEQLGDGGRLIAPVGPAGGHQRLRVAVRTGDGEIEIQDHGQVAFVPMVPGTGPER